MDLGAVQYPDCAGDLGTWLCLQTTPLPAAAPLQGHLQEEKSQEIWKLLLLLHLRPSFNLDWVQALLERKSQKIAWKSVKSSAYVIRCLAVQQEMNSDPIYISTTFCGWERKVWSYHWRRLKNGVSLEEFWYLDTCFNHRLGWKI